MSFTKLSADAEFTEVSEVTEHHFCICWNWFFGGFNVYTQEA